jgi:hypothetical protein
MLLLLHPAAPAAAAAAAAAALPGHEDSVEAVGFSRHLNLAATAGIDGKLIVWDCGAFSERGVCQHPEVSGCAAACRHHV